MNPTLVGRERELEVLRAAVSSVAGGTPGSVLLVGPPGVGKTRLAHEALALAGDAGFATFSGRCHELGTDTAYAPLAAALAPALPSTPAARQALVGDLPQLGLLFPGLGLSQPAPLGDPALERARLMNGLARLVERLVHDSPLALLIDDVHAADDSTIAFLHHMGESVIDRPLLLIATARPDDPGGTRLATLARDLSAVRWTSRRVSVEPLADAQAARLIDELLGAQADGQLAAQITERCAGRPLFVEALTRTLAENGHITRVGGLAALSGGEIPVPDAVRDQLRIRLAGLPTGERGLLDLLAVSGGELDYPVLADTAGQPRDAVVRMVDRLCARRLLVAGSTPAHVELVHGLLRDTLVAELTPAGIARAHAALAGALLRAGADDARVAEHVLRAGPLIDTQTALDQLARGATRAMRLAALEDAARYLAAACSAAQHLRQDQRTAQLHAELGTVQRWRGHYQDAQESWSWALAAHTGLGDVVAVAGVHRELGMLCWSTGELADAQEHFAAAERALDGLEPSPAHAELLYTKTVVASRLGDTATVQRVAPQLRTLAESLGMPRLSAQAYLAEAVLDHARADYIGMQASNLRALDAAERSGDPLLRLRAYDQLSVGAGSQLDLAQLRAYSDASVQITREIGGITLEAWPRCRLAVADLLGGDWDAALRVTADIIDLAQRFGEERGLVSICALHAWVLVHLGRLDDAEARLDLARRTATPMLESDRNIFSIVAIADASLAMARGDAERAIAWAPQLDNSTGGWMPLLGLSLLGEARASAADTDGAQAIAARLRAVRSCATVAHTTLADWIEALTELRRDRAASAAVLMDAAAAGFEQLAMPFPAARARLAAAGALAHSDAEHAVGRARAALECFDRLGAPIQAREARELLRSLGVVPSRGRGRRATGGPLSTRELEVARLVASGMSNAEVATALFISPRTVTTHLDRIYARLQLGSRVALTRYLADSGLLDAEPVARAGDRIGRARRGAAEDTAPKCTAPKCT